MSVGTEAGEAICVQLRGMFSYSSADFIPGRTIFLFFLAWYDVRRYWLELNVSPQMQLLIMESSYAETVRRALERK